MAKSRIKNKAGRFGTFGGVFTPSTLTILGVIMFLRFGEVVGHAGVWHALGIILVAKIITGLTALSLSAIATNTEVKGGGAYYLISRSLGSEFGGAIGLVFFVSQAVSVALYIIGFTEALIAVVPALAPYVLLVASIVNLIVFICVYVGADWAIRLQYFILGILVLAIGSFVWGALGVWEPTLFEAGKTARYSGGESVWTMFALFFPAATGIMAGANMSGDLENPSKSIPKGTLWAIGVTALVYAGFALLLAGVAPSNLLKSDMMIVSKVAIWSPLIIAGIFAATLSSALGSMMGAPRILQAIGRDGIFRRLTLFGKGAGETNEPRRAAILTLFLAQLGILVGDLNSIAPVITMFFMITYGALNFATFVEAYSGNPSYRPTFKYCHWGLSLIGTLLCCGVMFLIDPMWAMVAIVVMASVYRYLIRKELRSSWGDLKWGSALERIRRNLLILEGEDYHPKNWRPSVIVMGGVKEERLHIAKLGRALAGHHGLLMMGQVLKKSGENVLERHEATLKTMRKLIASARLEAFPVVTIAEDLPEGISALVQCSGVGVLRPNLVMFGWSSDESQREKLLKSLSTVDTLRRSVCVLRCPNPESPKISREGSIDVWWLGQQNGQLMLLLAHILVQSEGWRNRTIRLMRMISSEQGIEETQDGLAALAAEARIPVDVKVVAGKNFKEALATHSASASLVILGLPHPKEMTIGHLDLLESTCADLPSVLWVHSAGDMSLHV